MPAPTAPNTLAIANALVTYGSSLTYTGGASVYTFVQLGEIKDVTGYVVNGGACLEVYGNSDDSQRHAFGGKMWDEQTWFLLSLVSLNDAQAAETQICQVRDALVQPLQTHATLGNAGSVFHSEIKPGSGKFVRIIRNSTFYRAHILEVMTRQEWYIPTPPGVIS